MRGKGPEGFRTESEFEPRLNQAAEDVEVAIAAGELSQRTAEVEDRRSH